MMKSFRIPILPVLLAACIVAFQNCGQFKSGLANQSSGASIPDLSLDPNAPLQVAVRSTSANQTSTLNFTVEINKPDAQDVVIQLQSANGTAVAGIDYQPFTGSVTIPAGQVKSQASLITLPSGASTDRSMTMSIVSVSHGAVLQSLASGTILKYAPVILKNTWTPMSRVNAPSGRFIHSAIWTGTEMIVFGGESNPPAVTNRLPGYVLGSLAPGGGIFNPSTNTWRALATVGAPSDRTGHTAVWTGSKMIVFGGSNTDSAFTGCCAAVTAYSGGLNTGGIFDPATNSWTALPTLGAPSPRYLHVAVWTGSKMIVWGGIGAGAFRNDGASYDPVTNTWSPISSTNAPIRTLGPTNDVAVWTGSKMFVWAVSGGGLYDPATDTWTATDRTANLPTEDGRTGAKTAVLAGNEIIVFGTTLASVYSIATNTWSRLDTAPTFNQYGATSVWTGSEFVVYRGNAPNYIYNRAANTWTPIATANAPVITYNAKAVWTGNQMIVWGGNNFTYVGVDVGGILN